MRKQGWHTCLSNYFDQVVQKANKNKEALWVGIGIQPLVYVHPVRIFEFPRRSGYKNNTKFVVLYYVAANILNNTKKVFSKKFYQYLYVVNTTTLLYVSLIIHFNFKICKFTPFLHVYIFKRQLKNNKV